MEHGSPRTPAAVVPAAFAAVEAAAGSALALADEAASWDGPTRVAVLAWLDRHERVLTAIRCKVITAESRAGTWSVAGDRDVAGFVGRVSRQGRGAGLAAVGQAATLAAMPLVAEALVDGPVTAKHLAQITRAAETSPVLAQHVGSVEGQAQLVELAGRLDAQHFGTALKQLSASLDPAARQREHEAQRAGRYLHITHHAGGTDIKARMDAVAGRELAKAIDALCPRPAADDARSREQRMLDALSAMARHVLTDKATVPDAIAPVQAVLTLSEATWIALRATRQTAAVGAAGPGAEGAAAPMSPPGSAADVAARLQAVPPVCDEDGHAWPASEVGRALCDCQLTRAVLDATGQVLDLGMKERFFARKHWLALLASGQATCSVGACTIPLRYTELHHMHWWEHAGPTDYANLAPECSFHHHEIHRLNLTVSKNPDGTYEHRHPDGRLYGEALPAAGPPGRPPASPLDTGVAGDARVNDADDADNDPGDGTPRYAA